MKQLYLLFLFSFLVIGCQKLERISTLYTDSASLDSLDVVVTGNINHVEGFISDFGVCWAIGKTPTVDDEKLTLGEAQAIRDFVAVIKNLPPGDYSFRSYLSDAVIVYGDIIPLTIPPLVYSIDQLTVPIQLGSKAITIKTNMPLQISVDKEWVYTDKATLDSSGTILLTYEANDYAAIRTAHMTLTGTNGFVKTITITQGENHRVPMLVTRTPYDLTSSNVSTGGVIIEDGGSSVTEVGVCWSTHDNPTTSDFKVSGMVSDIYDNTITELTPGTIYYIKAYAINSTGTGYGQVIQVTTLSNRKFLDYIL